PRSCGPGSVPSSRSQRCRRQSWTCDLLDPFVRDVCSRHPAWRWRAGARTLRWTVLPGSFEVHQPEILLERKDADRMCAMLHVERLQVRLIEKPHGEQVTTRQQPQPRNHQIDAARAGDLAKVA